MNAWSVDQGRDLGKADVSYEEGGIKFTLGSKPSVMLLELRLV